MDTEIRIAELSNAKSVRTYYMNLLSEKNPYIKDKPKSAIEQEIEFILSFIDGSGNLLLAL